MTTFAEMTASHPGHVMLAQPPSSATQSKLQLSRCWGPGAHLYSIINRAHEHRATLPVRGCLCQWEEGPGKLLGCSLSPLKTSGALLVQHHLQPASQRGLRSRHLPPGPRLGSQPN